MQALAAMLVRHSLNLGSSCPRLVAAAAQELHAAASPVLQGCFSLSDSNAELVHALLEGLHAALQHSGHADGVLRGTVTLRLARILEEQEQHSRGLEVAQQVRPGTACTPAALKSRLHPVKKAFELLAQHIPLDFRHCQSCRSDHLSHRVHGPRSLTQECMFRCAGLGGGCHCQV